MIKIMKEKMGFNVRFIFYDGDSGEVLHKTTEHHPEGTKYFYYDDCEYVNLGYGNEIYKLIEFI